jgi:hypothetical protein
MSGRRRHSSVAKLPQELFEAVNSLLVEGVTYDEIVEFLREKGHAVSRSAVGRYGKDFLSKLEQIKLLEDQARTIVSEGGTPMAMEEALSKLITADMMKRMLEGGLKPIDVNFIAQSFARLQSSSVQRESWKAEVRKGVEKAAKNISRLGKRKGIDTETLKTIEQEVLGIAR